MLPVGNKHLISCSTCDHCQYTLPGQEDHAPPQLWLQQAFAAASTTFRNVATFSPFSPSSWMDDGRVGAEPSPAHPRAHQRWSKVWTKRFNNLSLMNCHLGIWLQRIKLKTSFDWITCSISPFGYSAGLFLQLTSLISGFLKATLLITPNTLSSLHTVEMLLHSLLNAVPSQVYRCFSTDL